MNPKLIGTDAKAGPQDRRFRTRELWRVLAMVWPFRKTLAVGLMATVIFASLHTVSIGAAFPVFKILLEEEGLRGWIDRTLAGFRLDVEFAPPDDQSPNVLQISKATGPGALFPEGKRTFETLRDPTGRSASELLHELAHAGQIDSTDGPAGEITLLAGSATEASREISIQLPPLNRETRLLRWAGSFIPSGADHKKIDTLKFILIGLIITVVVANVFRYVGEILIARSILRAMVGLRAKLYAQILCLPMSFFATLPTADLVTRFVQDVQEVQRGLMTLLGRFIREPLRALFIMALAFTLDWRITLTMIVAVPIAAVIFLAVGRSVKKANRKLLQSYGSMIGALTTSLHNLRVVKAYTAEDLERERLGAVDHRMFTQQLKLAKLQAFISPAMETIAIVAGTVVTVWLAGRVLNHELSVSKFAMLGLTLSMLFDPLRKLSDVYVRVQRSTAGAERIFQVMDQPIEGARSATATVLKPLASSIEYVDVSFTYPGADQPAVSNIDLSITQGETVALVGPNGCGKTTLVSMLPRFFDPDSGRICYDGVDLVDADLKSLRMQIGLVSQEAIVFAGTPVENIAYGARLVDEAKAMDAARRASADEFIKAIPGGYASSLGERGTTLSGGQRQRLAISRAIYRDAPILIFDEATSQIDTESEVKIQNALKEFAAGRTTIIIAHRLSTIKFADRIVVMEAGRIIDSGGHKELFDRCPLYQSLCKTQFVTEPMAV